MEQLYINVVADVEMKLLLHFRRKIGNCYLMVNQSHFSLQLGTGVLIVDHITG